MRVRTRLPRTLVRRAVFSKSLIHCLRLTFVDTEKLVPRRDFIVVDDDMPRCSVIVTVQAKLMCQQLPIGRQTLSTRRKHASRMNVHKTVVTLPIIKRNVYIPN